MKKFQPAILMLAASILFAGCSGRPAAPVSEHSSSKASSSQSASSYEPEDPVSDLLAKMTLEEKAAQLFITVPENLSETGTFVTGGEEIAQGYQEIPVGGLICFPDNLVSTEQIRTMNQSFTDLSMERISLPAFTAIDEEGGLVARAANAGLDLPQLSLTSEVTDPAQAYERGEIIGTYLSDLGFNMDFAPVADVYTNEENTVVAGRTFGSDPAQAADLACQFALGLEKEGVEPVFKHFPGHGNTSGDTHEGYAYSEKTLDELYSCELIPFQEAIAQGADAIMAAHISLPNVTGDDLPASLSRYLLTDLLRGQLGFQGVIISDAMNMGAIANNYSSSEAVLLAIEAGVDLILMPGNLREDWQAVIQAVQSGRISQERLDESVARIIRLKMKMNSHTIGGA